MGIFTKWILGLICLEFLSFTSAALNQYLFKPLGGTEMIDAPYMILENTSKVRCAVTCKAVSGCWVFTWDSQTRQCGLLLPLTSLASSVPAPASLTSYIIANVNGAEITFTKDPMTWEQCKVTCEDLGGRLFLPPDNAFAFVMHYISGENKLQIGMYRDPSDATVWYDMDGNVITEFLKWEPGQPNNALGIQYYVRLWHGELDDGFANDAYPCLCEIKL